MEESKFTFKKFPIRMMFGNIALTQEYFEVDNEYFEKNVDKLHLIFLYEKEDGSVGVYIHRQTPQGCEVKVEPLFIFADKPSEIILRVNENGSVRGASAISLNRNTMSGICVPQKPYIDEVDRES